MNVYKLLHWLLMLCFFAAIIGGLIVLLGMPAVLLYNLGIQKILNSITPTNFHKALSSFGKVGGLTGLIAVGALFEFDKYQHEQQIREANRQETEKAREAERREAAALALQTSFQNTIQYISEIILKHGLFQYKGHYPFNMPETRDNDSKPYPERPARLITNQLGVFKSDLSNWLPKIGTDAAKQVATLLIQLEQECANINGYLQAELGNYERKEIHKNYKMPNEYVKALQKIQEDAKTILTTFISSVDNK